MNACAFILLSESFHCVRTLKAEANMGLKGRSWSLGFRLMEMIMASCPKCGKSRLKKDTRGYRKCPHCGVLPGPTGLDRSGTLEQPIEPRLFFWTRLAIQELESAAQWRKLGHRKEAIHCIHLCRRWLELANG